jgi:hypothetical protein
MTIHKFPSENGRKRQTQREELKSNDEHGPEFISIVDLHVEDDDFCDDNSAFEGQFSYPFSSFGKLETMQLPLFARLLAGVSSLALFICSFFLICCFMLASISSILTFRKLPSVNEYADRCGRLTKGFFTMGLGLMILCFSPALGMGFIALYFAMKGEKVEDSFVQRFFYR